MPMPLLALPNVTAHPSTASVLTIVLLYNGPMLYDFNVGTKGLKGQNAILLNASSFVVCPSSAVHPAVISLIYLRHAVEH